MSLRIGYLAPEFPGQTHLFFWREIQGLKALDVQCNLVSTRRPPEGVVSQDWAKEAVPHTAYLSPFSIRDGFGALGVLLAAGPSRLAQCASIIARCKDLSLKGRLRLALLVLPAAKLVLHARRTGFEHVHVQSCSDSANIAMFASILGNVTYSLSLLGPTLEGYGPNQPSKWSHATFAVVMSQLLYSHVLQHLKGSLPPVVEVLPVGVDLDVMQRSAAYVPWQGTDECKVYSCGRLNKIKGHADLIEAVKILRERGMPVRLVIAGEDEQGGRGYRQELVRHIQKLDAGSYVTLLGAVGERAHRAHLEDAHVFALASLNEGISVAIMEAMAMQTPVVVTRVGGNHELIDDGQSGVLTVPSAPAVFADALASVLLDPARASALSNHSREKVAEKFDSRSNAKTLKACLDRCVINSV